MKKRIAIVCLFTMTLFSATACNNAKLEAQRNAAQAEVLAAEQQAMETKIDAETNSESDSTSTTEATVALTVDFGDGVKKQFPAIPWENEMTVFDTLEWAADQPHGIQFEHRGQGALALVDQIDDLKNGGGDGKNWIFRVNGKLGDSSCGVARISAGDEILWQFDVYR